MLKFTLYLIEDAPIYERQPSAVSLPPHGAWAYPRPVCRRARGGLSCPACSGRLADDLRSQAPQAYVMRQLNTPDCSLCVERLSSLQGFAPHPTRIATRGRPLTCGGCTLQAFSLSAEGMNSGRREPMTGATGTHGAEGRPVKRQTCKKGLRGLWMFFFVFSHIRLNKKNRTGVSLLE